LKTKAYLSASAIIYQRIVKNNLFTYLGELSYLSMWEAGAHWSSELGNRMWTERLHDKIIKVPRSSLGYPCINDLWHYLMIFCVDMSTIFAKKWGAQWYICSWTAGIFLIYIYKTLTPVPSCEGAEVGLAECKSVAT